jgi:hypothetical protein
MAVTLFYRDSKHVHFYVGAKMQNLQIHSNAELLENILSFLPAKTIFRVQRVSQTWKSTIAQSVSIQEKFFFRCQSTTPDVWEFSSVKDGDDDHKFSYCEFKV